MSPRAPKRKNNPRVEIEGKPVEKIEISKPKPHPLQDVPVYICAGTCKTRGVRTVLAGPVAYCHTCGDALIW